MFTELMLEFSLVGLIGSLLGIFYRNCLKVEDMIFFPLYMKVFRPWMKGNNRFLKFIALPLGGCIYCSTTWITFILLGIYLGSWDILPKWQDIVLGCVFASGVQHIIVTCVCRFVISGHYDLDYEVVNKRKKEKSEIELTNKMNRTNIN